MKKDIRIPESKNVYVAAVQIWNEDFDCNKWYIHLINENKEAIEMAIIVSQAHGTINNENRKSSMFRHMFKELVGESFEKVELLDDKILNLDNHFKLTYFLNDVLYEKTFVFKSNSINENATQDIPIINKRGVLRS